MFKDDLNGINIFRLAGMRLYAISLHLFRLLAYITRRKGNGSKTLTKQPLLYSNIQGNKTYFMLTMIQPFRLA